MTPVGARRSLAVVALLAATLGPVSPTAAQKKKASKPAAAKAVPAAAKAAPAAAPGSAPATAPGGAPASATAPVEADPNAPAEAVGAKIERGAGGKKIIRITSEIRIEGKIQKPEAFYVLQKSSINYEWQELKQDFVPRILDSVSKSPF